MKSNVSIFFTLSWMVVWSAVFCERYPFFCDFSSSLEEVLGCKTVGEYGTVFSLLGWLLDVMSIEIYTGIRMTPLSK